MKNISKGKLYDEATCSVECNADQEFEELSPAIFLVTIQDLATNIERKAL
jgi:hypothetical protein